MSDENQPLTIGAMRLLMERHEAVEAERNEEQLRRFMSAFPGGDPLRHCQFHETKIKAAEAEERFWQSAQQKVLEKGIEGLFGVLKIVALLTIAGLAVKFGIALPFAGDKW